MINLLQLGRITSPFGKRDAPTKGASTQHNGIDIVLSNKNVPAVLGGEVLQSSFSSSAGNNISIKAEDGTTHKYMHLATLPALKSGDRVKEGQIIGIMGSTGISTGAHLDFRVQDVSGNYINPKKYLAGAAVLDAIENPKIGNMELPSVFAKSPLPNAKEIATTAIKVVIVLILAGFSFLLIVKGDNKNG